MNVDIVIYDDNLSGSSFLLFVCNTYIFIINILPG